MNTRVQISAIHVFKKPPGTAACLQSSPGNAEVGGRFEELTEQTV